MQYRLGSIKARARGLQARIRLELERNELVSITTAMFFSGCLFFHVADCGPPLLEKAPNLNEEREKSIIFLKRGEREEEARAGEVKMLPPLQFILKPVQK